MSVTVAPSGASRRGLAGWLRGAGKEAPAINLALQGGGAHGAFTWGVLDALLDDPRVRFEGISGSSAGAMNAVVLANGWMQGGRDGARAALAAFWAGVGSQMPRAMVTQGMDDEFKLSPASRWFANFASYFTPTQLNPLALNPLRDLIERQIDFDRLRHESPFKLFVGATHAGSGKLRLFREHELTADMLLASACLPKIHHAVEVDGQAYWDGGYSANPAIYPLFYDCESSDVLLVLLSPLQRQETPDTVEAIETCIAELGFTAHFMREMSLFARAAEFARPSLLVMSRLERRLRRMRFHMVDTSEIASLQRSETRILAHTPFLQALREQGQAGARAWLAAHFQGVGRASTVDVGRLFG
jgi:NTE family protein